MFDRLRTLLGKPPKPSDPRDLFAREVEQVVRSFPGVLNVQRVPDDFALEVTSSGEPRRVYLENLFVESREMSPEQRRDRIAFHFNGVTAPPRTDSWSEARETFVPALRGATYGIELWSQHAEAAFVRHPFLPFVDLVVAMDQPTSMSWVARSGLAKWGVGEADVLSAAAARVGALDGAAIRLYDDLNGPLWMVDTNDTYESSRLLVPGWLASFKGKVEGRPIAIIPERATLIVGGDERPEMVERLASMAEREFDSSNRRLSPAIYTVDDDGRIVPYVRASHDPLAVKVRIGHEQLAMYEYGTQKEVLDKLYEATGHEVFVASYQVFQTDDGGVRSRCVWTRGARSYLPRAERVVLLILGDGHGAKPKSVVDVPFEAIEGRLTKVPDLHPARFETSQFPSDAELRDLAEKHA
jgi:hypothetical protein